MELKKTPLNEVHKQLNAKMVEFAGFEMPLQYTGIVDEHMAVRTNVGMFDVSHMGELYFKGDIAEVNRLVTVDVAKMRPGQVAYTMYLNEHGGVVDDLLVYRISEDEVFMVVNASNTEKDDHHVRTHLRSAERYENVSDRYFELAIQGPHAVDLVEQFFHVQDLKFFEMRVFGDFIVSRTGYTGEDGFEVYGPAEQAVEWWNRFMEAGKAIGLKPAGLGARDTLRFEAGLPLYGHELNDEVTPLEANYAFVVDWEKPDFIGKDVLVRQKEQGLTKKLMGLELSKGIARQGYKVFAGDEEIGAVTTGNMAPFLKKSIAMAFLRIDHAKIGTPVEVEVRGERVPAVVVSKTFYKRGR
ncbi:glycine cleavage system aminomethyltransferase GcvT [Coprothermobacteraceae bacterium]|nr:glycine cleavage system aminomethyltransferase GcvT [Coprothermobacteraceae bacterium]